MLEGAGSMGRCELSSYQVRESCIFPIEIHGGVIWVLKSLEREVIVELGVWGWGAVMGFSDNRVYAGTPGLLQGPAC